MASTSSTRDSQLLSKLDAFNPQLTGLTTTLGLAAAEVTSLRSLTDSFRAQIVAQEQAMQAAQSATARKRAARDVLMAALRSMQSRIKGSPAYSDAIAEQLGLLPPEPAVMAPTELVAAPLAVKPVLRCHLNGDLSVLVRFRRSGFTGVMLYGRRGDETQFTLMAKQIARTFVDDRPNLAAGQPEMRYYQAQYVQTDTPVGQMSDILVVTVPIRA
jgi:hypothetical protein